MPSPFTGSKIFCARPKIYLHIVAVTNILCQTKRWFALSKIGFCASTKVFEEALNSVKFLGWLKVFGLAKNILGPVKGQDISICVLTTCVCEIYLQWHFSLIGMISLWWWEPLPILFRFVEKLINININLFIHLIF